MKALAGVHLTAEGFDGVRRRVRVPRENSNVGALRNAVAEQWGWPPSHTRLVFAGDALDDDGALLADVGLGAPADSTIVRCWLTRPPTAQLAASEERGAALLAAARALLAWSKPVSARFWIGLVLWCLSAKLAGRLGFGNPYVLLSAFVLVFSNLGQRRAGELSAYNVFNPQFQELLGQLRLEHLEADLIDPHRLAQRLAGGD
jgi:hypothetical protein